MADRRPKYSDKAIIEALRRAQGFITIAARTLGCSRNTITDRISKSARVREAYEDINESHLDLSESMLLKAINQGDLRAITFHLERKGASRGYSQRHEVEVTTPGAGLLDELTPEQIDDIIAMRKT